MFYTPSYTSCIDMWHPPSSFCYPRLSAQHPSNQPLVYAGVAWPSGLIYFVLLYCGPQFLFSIGHCLLSVVYPECHKWHTLSCRIGKVVASHAEGCKIKSWLWLSCTDLYYARDPQGVLPISGWKGATSQLDLPSLMPLSIAGCGWLQLGVPHWATSVITASSR